MANEFGRRRPAANTQVADSPRAAVKQTEQDAQEGGAAEAIFSHLMGPLGGVIVGVLVVFLLAVGYVSGMRGMGRALDDSWSRKTIGPVQNRGEVDFSRPPACEVRSTNPEFRRIQQELCQ